MPERATPSRSRRFSPELSALSYCLHRTGNAPLPRLIAPRARWYNSLCYAIHKVARAVPRPGSPGRPGRLEFANLPHDFAETLELVFVGITIIVSLAIMVAFGAWWQR